MSFQEIILLLTFIGSCIYATVSLTLKVLEFLLKNKRAADLDRSQRQMKALHKAAIIMKIALRFRKAIFGAPSGTRTQDPLIKRYSVLVPYVFPFLHFVDFTLFLCTFLVFTFPLLPFISFNFPHLLEHNLSKNP